ncbi:MAG: Hint domain-containing protein [Alphaproteobacteria bacterium]|nr:Hint domain-containing protein [Alphaproteobacteria bacterium]
MATVTWIGKSSLHTDINDATDPLNWVGGIMPQPFDTIIIGAGSLGSSVAMDLIGQPGTAQTISSNTLQVAGAFDTVTFNNVTMVSSLVTAGDGAAVGQGFVFNITDSYIDSSSFTLGDNAVLNLTGSALSTLQLVQNSGDFAIRQAGTAETLVVNATGVVNSDAQFWVQPGGNLTINVSQLGTIAGYFGSEGAILNFGGTVTINGDSNTSTRFSNGAFMLLEGAQGAAVDQLNARMNSESGLISLLGETHGATLDVKTNMPGAQLINFSDSNGLLKLESNFVLPSNFNVVNAGTTLTTTVLQNFFARSTGFQPGDTIQLVGVNPVGLTYSYGADANYGNDVLTINRGTSEVARIRFQAASLVPGTGTIDGAASGNFKLVSAGSDTLITLGNSQNVVNAGTTVAVTGTLASWGGVTNGATTDWSAANWTHGSGAGGIPGQYQTAQISLSAAEAAAANNGVFTNYVLSVTSPQTAGSVSLADPFAALTLSAPLMVSDLTGQGTGGAFAAVDGKIDIAAGGTLTTTRLYLSTDAQLTLEPGGQLAIGGALPFALGGGQLGLGLEGYAQNTAGTIASAGNISIGTNASAGFNVSNDIVSQTQTSTVYGTLSASVTATYTQIGGAFQTGANSSASSLYIAGAHTVYTDAGGDASTPLSGGMLVGGGNLSVNALGTIGFVSGGAGSVSVQSGATLNDASFAMIGASFGSSGTVSLDNNAHWNIGQGGGTPVGSIVVGNTITGSATLWSSNLPWLTVGAGGTGTLSVNSSVVQLGTGELFNTAKMIIGGGSTANTAAAGAVFVQGRGALLDTGGGPLIVGQRSNGTLSVGNGGTVLVGAAAGITDIGYGLSIGNRSGTVGATSGVVNIQSGGSLIDDGDLVIGRDSQGTLNISSGAFAQVTGGIYLGGLLALNNGTIATTPFLLKGASSGVLSINGGGALTATAGTLDIWQGSTINLSASQLTIGNTMPVFGEFVVASGAMVQGAGMIIVNSIDSTLRNDGTVLAGGLTSNGTLSQGGATLEINAVLAGSGMFKLSPSSVLQLDNGLPISARFDFGTGNLGITPTAPEFIRVTSPITFHGTVSDFYGLGPSNNRIDFLNAGFPGGNPISYTANTDPTTGGTVNLTTNSGAVQFFVTGFHPGGFAASTDGAGTGIVVFSNDAAPCFAQGTRILTIAGERRVEALRVGDLVPVANGGRLRRIVWTGSTRIDLDRHADPAKVAPVRIAADAFGPGLPHRDLVVSPDHAVWTGASLVPAYLLANGMTVRREPTEGGITYWHVELDTHDLLLAEGLPAESYLDTGNRGLFASGPGERPLHPDLLAGLSARGWDERACLPLTLGGAALTAARAGLAVRAAALGYRREDDPAVELHAGGQALTRQDASGDRVVALVPPGTTEVVLTSRAAVPHEIDPGRDDRRRLGVAIAAVRFAGTTLPLDGAAGLHACEGMMRWTNGRAVLTLPAQTRAARLEIDLVLGMVSYPVAVAVGSGSFLKKRTKKLLSV